MALLPELAVETAVAVVAAAAECGFLLGLFLYDLAHVASGESNEEAHKELIGVAVDEVLMRRVWRRCRK